MASRTESFEITLGTKKCNIDLNLSDRSSLDGTLTKFAKIKTKNEFTLKDVRDFAAVYRTFEDRLNIDEVPQDLLGEFGKALANQNSKIKVANGDVTREIRVDPNDAAEFQKVIDSFKKTLKRSGKGKQKNWTPTTPEEFEDVKMKFAEKVLQGTLTEKGKGKDKQFANLFSQKLLRLNISNQAKLTKWTAIFKELKGLNSDSDDQLDALDVFLNTTLEDDQSKTGSVNVPPPNSQNITYSGCMGFCWAVLGANDKNDFIKFNIYAKMMSTMKQADRIQLLPELKKTYPKMINLSDETQGLNSCPYRKTQICFVNRMSNIGLTLKLFRTVTLNNNFIKMLIAMNNRYEELQVKDDERNSNQILHESLFNSKSYYEVDNFVGGSTARVTIRVG